MRGGYRMDNTEKIEFDSGYKAMLIQNSNTDVLQEYRNQFEERLKLQKRTKRTNRFKGNKRLLKRKVITLQPIRPTDI